MIHPASADDAVIAVIGLGYVGLPLAAEFGKQREVIGFDVNETRLAALREGRDTTREVDEAELADARHLAFTSDTEDLRRASIYIVTVPSPLDPFKNPDLGPLKAASRTIGLVLQQGDIVVYKSTVYPGATEEDCVPILEEVSGLTFNVDFFCGYSPERINPGDKTHRLPNIRKVTSGSTPGALAQIDALYAQIITAGTFQAGSIRIAEAAKVIENTQRDLNIALINELAIIFNRLGIDTASVLEAAGTKWNFLPFRPGLVGGHCIGVDPYYLTHKAEASGYHPHVILAGRRINDSMGRYIAGETVKAMLKNRIQVQDARVLVMGLTFKENCPDLRNTRVIDVVRELSEYGVRVDVHDPCAEPAEALHEYDIALTREPENGAYDAIVLAVAHSQFAAMAVDDIRRYGKHTHVLYDLKHVLPADASDMRL